jgi:hypothetical protein
MKFAFSNDIGDISEVHRTGTGYVVAVITEKRKEGYRDLEELKEQLRPQVVYERQMNKTFESQTHRGIRHILRSDRGIQSEWSVSHKHHHSAFRTASRISDRIRILSEPCSASNRAKRANRSRACAACLSSASIPAHNFDETALR